MLGFRTFTPAPVHVLLVPKKHIARLSEAQAADHSVLGKMMLVAPQVARAGLSRRFPYHHQRWPVRRQDVFHLHMHVLGGPRPLGRMMAMDE